MATAEAKTGNTATVAGLRDYADFLEKNVDVPRSISVTNYSVRDDATVLLLIDSGFTFRKSMQGDITYIFKQFGDLTVEYVVKSELVFEPSIVGGKVVWSPKKEFRIGSETEK